MAKHRSSSPGSVARATFLVGRHTDVRKQIRDSTKAGVRQALTLWSSDWRPGWRHVPRDAALARVNAGRVATARATWSYLDQLGKQRADGAPTVPDVRPAQFERAFERIDAGIAAGKSFDAALDDADAELDKALAEALSDATLVATVQHGEAINAEVDGAHPQMPGGKRKAKVIGHRRVIHPELSASGTTCGLCIAAAQQIYRRGDLKPIHDRCNCGVSEVTEVDDPGHALNVSDLKKIYRTSDGTDAASLKRTRWRVDDGGSPVAVVAPDRRSRPEKARPGRKVELTAAQYDARISRLERLIADRESQLPRNEAQVRALRSKLRAERRKRASL